mgnify:CR=1 FL=1
MLPAAGRRCWRLPPHGRRLTASGCPLRPLQVREVAAEADTTRFPPSLVPTDYFVQNVVDVLDLLAIRHCIFAIGSTGNTKAESWKT